MPGFGPATGFHVRRHSTSYAPKSFDAAELFKEIKDEMEKKHKEHKEYEKSKSLMRFFTRYKEKETYEGELKALVTQYEGASDDKKAKLRQKLIGKMEEGCSLGSGFRGIVTRHMLRLKPAEMELKAPLPSTEERKGPSGPRHS
jgi:hypothetical protein